MLYRKINFPFKIIELKKFELKQILLNRRKLKTFFIQSLGNFLEKKFKNKLKPNKKLLKTR